MFQFQEERIYAAASALKSYENIIQETIEYTKQRETFGKPILDNQIVQFKLAELQTEVELLRALTYNAVEEYIDGKDVLTKASMVKLKSGRLGRELTDACLQFWGGMGFMWESSVARAYRDTRLGSIGGGSDEVMLGIISKQMGLLDKKRYLRTTRDMGFWIVPRKCMQGILDYPGNVCQGSWITQEMYIWDPGLPHDQKKYAREP